MDEAHYKFNRKRLEAEKTKVNQNPLEYKSQNNQKIIYDKRKNL